MINLNIKIYWGKLGITCIVTIQFSLSKTSQGAEWKSKGIKKKNSSHYTILRTWLTLYGIG